MPAARISCGSAWASASTISTSWIIRSSTTSTSRLRGLKTLSRWISKNRGSVARRSNSTTAGLKRSRWPTCRMRPCRSAASTMRPAGARSGGDGLLHQHVDAGRRAARQATASWAVVGTATMAASTLPGSSAEIGECLGAVQGGGFGGAGGVGVHHRAQFGALRFVNHAAVVLAELSRAQRTANRIVSASSSAITDSTPQS